MIHKLDDTAEGSSKPWAVGQRPPLWYVWYGNACRPEWMDGCAVRDATGKEGESRPRNMICGACRLASWPGACAGRCLSVVHVRATPSYDS